MTKFKDALARFVRDEKPNPRPTDLLTFSVALQEIKEALKIHHEAAAMTLYGLCATGNVRSLNDKQELIGAEECTIGNFEGSPAFVVASDVRNYLTEWSPDPQRKHRDAVIAEMLQDGTIRRNTSWKDIYKLVRDRCNGWIVTGGEQKPDKGFGDKQIQRIVNQLRGL
jgi:hypothetical protein